MNPIALALAAAVATTGPALPPAERGAVDSPVAFHEACTGLLQASKLDPVELDKELNKGDGTLGALAVMMGEFCHGMIATAVTTVRSAESYTVSGHKICLKDDVSGAQVLDELGKLIDQGGDEFTQDSQITTPVALVVALQRLSTCD